jgi:iron complex outermembrane receptor protein
VYRNLGRVNKKGIDGSISYAPIKDLTLYAFGSINHSKIKDNLQLANSTFDCGAVNLTTAAGRATAARNCAFTAGQSESGSPRYSFGASGVAKVGPLDFGLTAKRTGPRFVYDSNEPVRSGDVDVESGIVELFPAKAPAYWLVNLDVRYNLGHLAPALDKSYFQLNVYNLFDATYVGGFTGGLNQPINASSGVIGTVPFVQIGAPRTVSGTLNIAF